MHRNWGTRTATPRACVSPWSLWWRQSLGFSQGVSELPGPAGLLPEKGALQGPTLVGKGPTASLRAAYEVQQLSLGCNASKALHSQVNSDAALSWGCTTVFKVQLL